MYQGSFVSLITPFNKKLEIDNEKLEELVLWHLDEKTDGLVVGCNTGEGSSLNVEEKRYLLKRVLDVTKKNIPVIFATKCLCDKDSILLTKQAKQLGADGCLVNVPCYSKSEESKYFQYFYEASKIGVPLIICHDPKAHGVKLSPRVLSELSTLPYIIGIQEGSGESYITEDILSRCYTTIFSGQDAMTYNLMQKGAQGSISNIANIIPSVWARLISLYFNKEYDKALFLQKKHEQLSNALILENPSLAIKYALSLTQRCLTYTRASALPLPEASQEAIKKAMKQLSLI
jgi:4-hydroxy-tetrahydrodipicolinate synthase